MASETRVIARRAAPKQSPPRTHERVKRDCFASLAMTLLLVLAASPAHAADGDVDQGRDTYQDLCSSCHGPEMVSSGTLSFDLRKFPKDDFARFRKSVLEGKGSAMPAWTGKISDEDVVNLWAYVKSGGG
jgi:mono/diheme cytochrome c family protein